MIVKNKNKLLNILESSSLEPLLEARYIMFPFFQVKGCPPQMVDNLNMQVKAFKISKEQGRKISKDKHDCVRRKAQTFSLLKMCLKLIFHFVT
jgi:hypothetical protein